LESEKAELRVLVVDDDEHLRKFITRGLSRAGFSITTADSGATGIERLRSESFDAVLCDLHMPEVDGLDVLRFAAGLQPMPQFIVLTGYGSVSVAVEAMKRGAADFLEKPVSIDELRGALHAVLARRPMQAATPAPARAARSNDREALGLVGDRSWLDAFMESLQRIAHTDSTVLIEGETGTGKSAVAREIARLSARASGPFVELNCAAIPENLLENELFGHVRGAYTSGTGATGKVELASGGTLFLDEIGELKHEIQAKLLHLLQERTFTPIGSPRPKRADVRFIAATNRNLLRESEEGRFRLDLYYRLNVVSLTIPPLRERREDVPLLIEHFRRRIAERLNANPPTFSPEAVDLLRRYRWPGNVRELENLVERMAVMHPGKVIDPSLIGERIRQEASASIAATLERAVTPPPATQDGGLGVSMPLPQDIGESTKTFNDRIRAYEIAMIKRALSDAGGNKSRAAKALGMKRTTLIEKMKKLEIQSEGDDEPTPET
jgi:DNA-binding NtrC family response regulator